MAWRNFPRTSIARSSSFLLLQATVAIAHDFPTLLGAAVEGVGIAQVPEPISAGLVRAGKLVHVLEPFAPMAPGVFLYYPSRHQMMPKLRAFVDHVKSRSATASKTQVRIDERRTRGVKIR